jgi:hypothetical protein
VGCHGVQEYSTVVAVEETEEVPPTLEDVLSGRAEA